MVLPVTIVVMSRLLLRGSFWARGIQYHLCNRFNKKAPRVARDLDLPMIVMGVRGRSSPPEELLFGSTAEKVLRGTRVPVLCVPF